MMHENKKSMILTAARSVFLRYGYKRVNMSDLAEAASVSRPALYLLFKNKEEIFIGVFRDWVAETLKDVEAAMSGVETPRDKIGQAFEIWVLRPFELALASPEAQELIDCSFGFARMAQQEGYATFEAIIAPVLALIFDEAGSQTAIAPDRIAHVLASAVRGFKLTAETPDQLRLLVDDLLTLALKSTELTRRKPS